MDVLRALSTLNLDIRKKTIDIVLDLITPRNVEEVVVKTQNLEHEEWRV